MTAPPPSYLELRQAGYQFTNHGVLLGDRPRQAALCWYGILAPDGEQIGSAKGITAALEVARTHYDASA